MITKLNRSAAALLVTTAMLGSGAIMLVSARAAELTPQPTATDATTTTMPATVPTMTTTEPTGRSVIAIQADLRKAGEVATNLLTGPEDFTKQAKREELKAAIVPALNETLKYADELARFPHPTAQAQGQDIRREMLLLLALYDDPAAIAALESAVKGADADEAMSAKSSQMVILWWKAADRADEQTKILDEMTTLARDNANDDKLATALDRMSQIGAANPELSERALNIIINDLKGPKAHSIAQEIAMQEMMSKKEIHYKEQQAKLDENVGKPMNIEGQTVDGKAFTSADMKGKVILVDFWATWCPPCVAALPKLQEFYAANHDKGLEIIGVSSDNDIESLKGFLADNKELTWTQLVNTTSDELHPIATKLGIDMIPVLLVIDRNGILRATNGVENYQELVAKLLDEKPN